MLEVMVAAAIGLIVILGSSSMIVSLHRSVNAVQYSSDVEIYNREMRTLLGSVAACTNTFGSLTVTAGANLSINPIRDGSAAPGVARYSVGDTNSTKTLTLRAMSLGQFVAGSVPNTAQLTLSSTLNQAKGVSGPQMLVRFINIIAQTNNSNNIVSCTATSGASDGIWQRTPANMTNISFMSSGAFNTGLVGIGSDTMRGTLHVQQNGNSGIFVQGVAGMNFGNADIRFENAANTGSWDVSASNSGQFSIYDNNSGHGAFVIWPGAPQSSIDVAANGNVSLGFQGGAATALQVNGVISPKGDGTYDLGASNLRFNTVYASNGTVNTSDAREKKDVQPSDFGLEFLNRLRPVSYRWRKGDDRNLHYGLIAQETEAIVSDLKNGSVADPGNVIVAHDKTTDRYGIRYTELIAPIIKAVQEVDLKVADEAAAEAELALQIGQLKAENNAMRSYLCARDPGAGFCLE